MITSKFLKQTKTYLSATLLLTSLIANAQEPVATTNTEITGTSVESYFAQEPDDNAAKTTFAINLVDGDPDTDWAGNTSAFTDEESFLIIDLEGTYDLAEVQLLTVSKSVAYIYNIAVSTSGTDADDFTDVFTANEKNANGNLESNLDATYKSFVLPSVATGAKYVKIFCYGRANNDSTWSTISELKFYEAGVTASTRDNTLSQALIYPNPANDVIYLSDINENVNKVDIVSLEGRIVLSKTIENPNQQVSLSTSALKNGVYFLNFSNTVKNSNSSKTIIVQH